jgi:hypothetical protein
VIRLFLLKHFMKTNFQIQIARLSLIAIALIFMAILSSAAFASVGDQFGVVGVNQEGSVQIGKIAFVDVNQSKLIEMDTTGKVTWEYSIPFTMTFGSKLSSGTDVEWLPASDNFLLAIPEAGVFEVNRKGEVVWQYKTRYVDHDADRLPNGNTVFVNGWDADGDPVVTEVDPSGKIVMQLFAEQLGLDVNERHSAPGERYSNTHANAVQQLADGEYLISLRNYNQFLRYKDGKVVARYMNARNVHDPLPFKGGYLFAIHYRDSSQLILQRESGQREPFFKPEPGTWTPLRTVELLKNGNILVTGSREVGQLDEAGKLVWSMVIESYANQKSEQRKKAGFIYKATFVYK